MTDCAIVDPLAGDWGCAPSAPLAIVDLDRLPTNFRFGPLPACPLIGIGDPGHPAAAALDATVEPPVTLDMLGRKIAASPRAAAALVHLLRTARDLSPEPALTAESICYAMLQGSAEHRRWLEHRPATPRAAAGMLRIARSGDVLHLRIDRPAARNAIDRALRDALYEAFILASLDTSIASVRLTGAGRSFSLGADLAEFGTTRDPAEAHLIRMATLPARALVDCAGRLTVHVQGACVGAGLELAAFARRLTASADAWFQLPELAMGIIPGAGGTVSMPRRIGRSRAALLMLSGRRIDARTALRWGLVDAIVDTPPVDEHGADMS